MLREDRTSRNNATEISVYREHPERHLARVECVLCYISRKLHNFIPVLLSDGIIGHFSSSYYRLGVTVNEKKKQKQKNDRFYDYLCFHSNPNSSISPGSQACNVIESNGHFRLQRKKYRICSIVTWVRLARFVERCPIHYQIENRFECFSW